MPVDAPRTIALEIPSRLDCIELIGETLRALCPLADLSEAESYRIELGIVEALNNVVEHAYGFQPESTIRFELTFHPGRLQMVIRDWGRPRPGNLSHTLTFEQDIVQSWPEGGMGLFIMHEVMDEIAYERLEDENCLTLIKYIP
ncbi:MAG: ATP-binding protein [Rhodothermales bacterium]